jgi:hypothetical protein
MVYDGVPTFISGNTTDSRLLGTFCGFEQNYNESFQTSTGTVTVYYEIDLGKFKKWSRLVQVTLNDSNFDLSKFFISRSEILVPIFSSI